MAASCSKLKEATDRWCSELSSVSNEISSLTIALEKDCRGDQNNGSSDFAGKDDSSSSAAAAAAAAADDDDALLELIRLVRRIQALEMAGAAVQTSCQELAERRQAVVTSLQATNESNDKILNQLHVANNAEEEGRRRHGGFVSSNDRTFSRPE